MSVRKAMQTLREAHALLSRVRYDRASCELAGTGPLQPPSAIGAAKVSIARALDELGDPSIRNAFHASISAAEKACERCHGAKRVTLYGAYYGGDADDQPCPDCAP